jgi:altronate hydrolase
MQKVLQIRPEDKVAIALTPLKIGEVIQLAGNRVELTEDIPLGHKLAIRNITKGETVVRYGYPIGNAITDIKQGQWVHSHNLASGLKEKLAYSFEPDKTPSHRQSAIGKNEPTFKGYRRSDGKVGIRNEIWLINTVGCTNKQTEKLARLAQEKFKRELQAGGIDGIYAFSHPYGCSQLGEDLLNTQKILAGLVNHPHAAGVLVVGLGCENNRMVDFQKIIGPKDPGRIKFLTIQDVADEIETGLSLITELIKYAAQSKQESLPISELKIGLKCGGSDGFSGITANPLVGEVSDQLISYGGTCILSEVPEMFGAETILMNRAKDRDTFEQIVKLVNNFKEYFLKNGQEVYENPSPGNKDGGITTLEEKSLGCTQKGGTSPVEAVLNYGDQVKIKGLNLLEGPGNDIVSTTALTAAGVNMILFTTGRGTPLGAPVPTIKIATNTGIFNKKTTWFDFDAGRLLTGISMENLTEELFAYVVAAASKELIVRNEINDYRDIAIFKTGVTL